MTTIFEAVREACNREDCRLWKEEFGWSNSAGSNIDWHCTTCKRWWSVWTEHPPYSSCLYDRNGNIIPGKPTKKQTVTEFKR